MSTINVLLVGESWISSATHFKGWDQFNSVTYHSGAGDLIAALHAPEFKVDYITGHDAGTQVPLDMEGLQQYQVVILSDIGANTLLLHPDTWLNGKRVPNRLKLLREYVHAGGGLCMVGGYYSFAGINGSARYHGTAVEEVLPVTITPYDDRVEAPEGTDIEVRQPAHPVLAGIDAGTWPYLLGYNQVTAKEGAQVVLAVGFDPLLATMEVGAGRSLVWTSDIGPHWCPQEFVNWEGYGRLWRQSVRWLAGDAV